MSDLITSTAAPEPDGSGTFSRLRAAALAAVAGVSYALSDSAEAAAGPYCCNLVFSPDSGCPSWCNANGHNITGWTCNSGGFYYWCGECSDHSDESCWTGPFYCSWYSRA